mgnify:FL=1|tara:strand:+ start:4995 stop:5324 length:330 start_codon:yes stop_codon:yes gene_type:complete
MGLDQYAFARKQDKQDREIMYWRKHANLEGWMADLYAKRGGRGDFNCVELKLRLEDIEQLEKDYRNLEHASGFFWGQSCPENDNQTEDFIAMAYKELKDGYDIIYTSWW